jgi:hypothetical protein
MPLLKIQSRDEEIGVNRKERSVPQKKEREGSQGLWEMGHLPVERKTQRP